MSNERNRAENERGLQLVTIAAAAAAFLPLAESVGLCEEGDVGRVVRLSAWSPDGVSECPQYFLKPTRSILSHTHFWG